MDFIEDQIEEELETEIMVLNRSVVVLQLNETFYSWYLENVNNCEQRDSVLEKVHTFLIPPLENDNEVEDYLVDNYHTIFEALLEEYIDSDEILEQILTADNFDNWVEYNFSTFVMDAASDIELSHEDEIEETEEKADLTV